MCQAPPAMQLTLTNRIRPILHFYTCRHTLKFSATAVSTPHFSSYPSPGYHLISTPHTVVTCRVKYLHFVVLSITSPRHPSHHLSSCESTAWCYFSAVSEPKLRVWGGGQWNGKLKLGELNDIVRARPLSRWFLKQNFCLELELRCDITCLRIHSL